MYNFIYCQYSPSEMMCGLYWEYPWFCVITAVYIPVLSGMYNFIYCQYSPSEMMCGLYWEYPWFCVITAVYIPVLSGNV